MRVIVIEDKDCEALLNDLKLENFNQQIGGPDASARSDMHRAFHYRVVRWLQAQGYSR